MQHSQGAWALVCRPAAQAGQGRGDAHPKWQTCPLVGCRGMFQPPMAVTQSPMFLPSTTYMGVQET